MEKDMQERIETLVSKIEQMEADWAKDAAQVTALRTALEQIEQMPCRKWEGENFAKPRAHDALEAKK